MIEEIEVLMRHWSAQIGRNGVGCSSISSSLAGLIEWQARRAASLVRVCCSVEPPSIIVRARFRHA